MDKVDNQVLATLDQTSGGLLSVLIAERTMPTGFQLPCYPDASSFLAPIEATVEEKGIAPHIPVFDKSKRNDGTFSRGDFRYDPTGDVYHCPGGKQLGTSGPCMRARRFCTASKLDCDVCPLKPKCCPKEPSRKIPRDIHEHARDIARSFVGTEDFKQSRRERKRIEMRFAHLKRILRLGRLRLRGPRGAQDEFVLAAIAQNLRRLAWLVARPPPAGALCIA